MKHDDLEAIRGAFDAYALRHAGLDGVLHPVQELKRAHSRRVAEEARAIAVELDWPAGELNAAEALGWLHDVARFPQYARFRTLEDRRSFDHGAHGADVVTQAGWLDGIGLAPALRDAILDGIRWHNRKTMPDGLPEDSLRFLRLIRDADKLDILRVIGEALRDNRLRDYPELLFNIALDGPPSADLAEEILTTRVGSYERVRSWADMTLIRLTWIHDVNYDATLRRLRERGWLAEIVRDLPDTPAVAAIVRDALGAVERRIGAG